MDKGMGKPTQPYHWLPEAMPRVAEKMRRMRAEMGNAHVNECFKRGVLKGEPGWFYAREGSLAVGTPWGEWLALQAPVNGLVDVVLVLKAVESANAAG